MLPPDVQLNPDGHVDIVSDFTLRMIIELASITYFFIWQYAYNMNITGVNAPCIRRCGGKA